MSNFPEIKRQVLEKRRDDLVEEWTAATRELSRTLAPVDRIRLQRQADEIERVIKDIERQLVGIETPNQEAAAESGPAADNAISPVETLAVVSSSSPNLARASFAAGAALKVFLCHGKEDKATVRQLHDRLQADGIEPWLDDGNLLPGQNWQQAITRAVRQSDVVLVCLSGRTATKQGFIQREIKLALDVADEKPEGTIFLIPVRFEECEVPERVGDWGWVNYFAEDGYKQLMQALEHRAATMTKTEPGATAPPATMAPTTHRSAPADTSIQETPPSANVMPPATAPTMPSQRPAPSDTVQQDHLAPAAGPKTNIVRSGNRQRLQNLALSIAVILVLFLLHL